MHYLLLLFLLLAVILGPQWWVQQVLSRYNRKAEENFPGTGSELARHLLGESWQETFLTKAKAGGIERVLL